MERALRSIVRHRKNLVQTSSTCLNRIQKALELMSIKLHTIISDIDVKTGLLIIEAILKGERDPEVLADLRNRRIKASREGIIKSLEGHWTTEHHFTSWLNLVPNTKISGGKIISSRIRKKKHHAGQAFRIAANSLYNSKSPLGDYYRRIRAKAGAAKAVVATARKLAIIYYKMVSKKETFNPKALEVYQKKYNEKKINQLKKKLLYLRQLEKEVT